MNKNTFPTSARDISEAFSNLQHTSDYAKNVSDIHKQTYDSAPTTNTYRRALARVAKQHFDGALKDSLPVNKEYAGLIGALPDFAVGIKRIAQKNLTYDQKIAAKRLIIPFNHSIEQVVDTNPSLEPQQLRQIVSQSVGMLSFDNPGDIIRHIDERTIPGMEHELAGETNLYYLPGSPEIINTTEDEELLGVDRHVVYGYDRNNPEAGMHMTVDFKASEQRAESTRIDHEAYRKSHGITTPDNHIIMWTGYKRSDFVPGKIGRVTDEARQRVQSYYNQTFRAKYEELKAHQQNILTVR